MKISEEVRTFVDVLAIVILWLAILLMVGVASIGDCFEPGCGAGKDHFVRIALALVAIGFVAHVAGYWWLKAKRGRRK